MKKTEEKEVKKVSLEENFAAIEEVLTKMEDAELPLEERFRLYEDGVKRLKECSGEIDMIEKKVKLLSDDGSLEDMD
jgi:exodeoxyribonuclease VII small subunit